MTIEIKLTGPIFQPGVSAKVEAARDRIIKTCIEDGMKHLAEMARPRPAGVYLSVGEAQKGHASTGNYRRNITPVIQGANGRLHDNNVVYGPWLEGVGSRNGTTRFRGYAMFRKTGDWLEGEDIPKVLEKEAKRLQGELGG